ESLVGKLNSTEFRCRAAGSVMLARSQGGRQGGGRTIEFGFAYIPNDTNIPVGDITVSAKDGFDLLWAYYASEEDAAAADKGLVKRPLYAYVERVYPRADLTALSLPA